MEGVLHNGEVQGGPAASLKKTSGRHKRRVLMLLGVLVAVAVALGTWFYLDSQVYETTDDAFIEGHPIAISGKVAGHVAKIHVTDNQAVNKGDLLVELDARDFEWRVAQAKAALAAAVARQKAAQTGTEVTRMTTDAAVEQAEAGVKLAESAVSTAQIAAETAQSRQIEAAAQLAAAEATASQTKADIVSAEAEAKRADSDLRRFQELIATKSVSQQQLDTATAAAQSATAKLESNRGKAAAAEAQVAYAKAAIRTAALGVKQAEYQLAEARARLGEAQGRLGSARSAPQQVAVSQSQAEMATADIAQAEAALRQAELNLSYTKIYAPEAGRVTRRTVEEGAYFQVGQPMCCLVPRKVWVIANFKETQLTHMQAGQAVSIHVDAYPQLEFAGKVDSIQSGTGARFSLLPPENATGNYVKVVQRVPVKIVFDQEPDAAHLLAPGMSVIPKVRVR
ncbi:MAG TPA: HlyD family secretion protein [Tepidisphaeraceae bacterium]|nr:HlyD family secretion protein [Tepidisphaeraceae bacterium]